MPAPSSHPHAAIGPTRGQLCAIGLLLLTALIAAAATRLSGVDIRTPDAAAKHTRMVRFEDRPDGRVVAIDATRNRQIAEYVGEQGFVRGTLRGLARERRLAGASSAEPFELIARVDGRLTLRDTATGRRIDLESFGPANAGAFARLLHADATTLHATGVQP